MENYKSGYFVPDANKYFVKNSEGGYDEVTKEFLDSQEEA